jgi:hypothetical protein
LAVQVFDWGLVIEMTTAPGAGVAAPPELLTAVAGAEVTVEAVLLVASAVTVPPVPGEAATTTPRQAVSEISDASGTATAATLVIEERMGGSPSRGKFSDEVTNVSIN